MGFFEKLKQNQAQRRYEADLERWQFKYDQVKELYEDAQALVAGELAQDETPIRLKPGEDIFAVVEGAGLVEPRRLPGQWVGGSRGISVPIVKGVRYRVGASQGAYQQGAEQQTMVDVGTAVITSQRVVFMGPKYTREWAYSKLIGYQHGDGATYLHVSNRQKVSGIAHGGSASVVLRLEVALARHHGEEAEILQELAEDLKSIEGERPSPPQLSLGPGE